jgi:phytanoyl-CoA hydroxylase
MATSDQRCRRLAAHLRPLSPSPAKPVRPAVAAGSAAAPPGEGFRYTLANNVLTLEERQSYEENGFLVKRGVVPPERLAAYLAHFLRICSGEADSGQMLVMRDVAIAKSENVPGQAAITKLQDWQDDDELFDYCVQEEVLRHVRCFVGPAVRSTHTMLINKPPDPGGGGTSRHPLHQDLYYFPFGPADRVVCAWTAMERVHRGNGCLTVLPGSHRGELLAHAYPEWGGGVNKMYHGITGDALPPAQVERRVHVEMEAGDTVFFHPLLVHGSGMNRTEGFRKAISCHYAAADAPFAPVVGTVQEPMMAEVLGVLAKKVGVSEDQLELLDPEARTRLYHAVWRVKNRAIDEAAKTDANWQRQAGMKTIVKFATHT